MKRIIAGCFAIMVATASLAEAQATRTWVSGVGDDANPCSRTAPCKTFAGAISKTAAGGYMSVLDPGGFGAVTITKSITIDGQGVVAGVLAAATNGIVINNTTGVVILRNLSLEGAGTGLNGIRVMSNAVVHIENVTIKNFVTNGIFVTGASAEVYITDTLVESVADQAINFQSGKGTINRTITNTSGVGVLAGYTSVVQVKNSVASGNDIGYGALYAATAQLNIEDSLVSHNSYGVYAGYGATARLSRVSLYNNTTALLDGGSLSKLISFSNNMFAGNLVDGAFTGNIAVK